MTSTLSAAVLAAVLLAPALTLAASPDLPVARPVPGGVATLSLGPSNLPPTVRHAGVPVLVVGDPIEWTAVLGLPLGARAGQDEVTVQREGAAPARLSFTVAPMRYAELLRADAPPVSTTFPLPQALAEFLAVYAGHIAREEAHAYPQAQTLLDATTLVDMGEEMRARRRTPATGRTGAP